MARPGVEVLRKTALIDAAIAVIGERGSLDVTMSDIAGRAGVSTALAHHYFGAKDDLLEATMRRLLADLTRDSIKALRRSETPRQRIAAVIDVNFSVSQFRQETIHAWLAFYVAAQRSAALRRLLNIYARRLNSNLLSGLSRLLPETEATRVAEAIAALIDGLYIRRALRDGLPNPASASALVEDYVEMKLAQFGASASA